MKADIHPSVGIQCQVYDPAQLITDFLRALDREQSWHGHRPSFPEPSWHRCLQSGFEADMRRLLDARRRELDAHSRHISYREFLGDSATARMNGSPIAVEIAEPLTEDRRHQSHFTDSAHRHWPVGGL